MPTATSEDTEITLGTGKMLALFFGLVGLCAVFFGFGFSLGKSSALKPSAAEASLPAPAPLPAAVLRPSAVKPDTLLASSTDAKNTISPDQAPDVQTAAATSPAAATDTGTTAADPKNSSDAIVPPALNGYYVQVAAVSKQEDADALVDALKRSSIRRSRPTRPLTNSSTCNWAPTATSRMPKPCAPSWSATDTIRF